jgi:hypothetical protein
MFLDHKVSFDATTISNRTCKIVIDLYHILHRVEEPFSAYLICSIVLEKKSIL